MRPDEDMLARLEALLAETQSRIPARRARLAELVALLERPAGEVTKYERGAALEEIANRGYVFGGHESFAAFLKAHGIARTTAHRLRVLARASDAATVAELGPHRAYRRARGRVLCGETIDPLTTTRRVRAWMRSLGFPYARVELGTDKQAQPCVRIEIRVKELWRVTDQPRRERR